ncbi:LysR family transcriptional regulator [Bifidobacterium aemilianum]|uniref:LysR family transcriptional regulator n=1 Tax=Bifidobacterium aemilianum TaxID=2493120 RepID=A0A366K937_9BIFI|nr:LysR family transcriptional regulator [Bifidobacterium aemilianum]RBP97678.1 LysR family transcriptional regulator [Bifidobacterium aemilianum]
MNLRVLRYFLAIVEEGSISGAAQYLNIAQPSLSRQIKELETSLGHKLFERGSRSITLTPAGVLLRDRAREIVLLADRTEAELSGMEQTIGGTVYIGAGESDGVRLLARAAKAMIERYPKANVQLFSGNGEAVTYQLEAGLLDFGLLFEPTDTTRYSYIPLPTGDRWGLLMPKDCELAKQPNVSAEDLRQLPLLVSAQTRFDREFSRWGELAREDLHIVGSYNLLFNASLFVSEGCGYALCLDGIINASGDSDLIFRPLEPRLVSHMNLVWKSDRHFSPLARAYLSILRESLAQ